MSKYLGSEELQVSTANQEVIPNPPADWTIGYFLKVFSFVNFADCTVLVNNESKLFLKAGQGFNASEKLPISSFKVIESGIEYNWIGVS